MQLLEMIFFFTHDNLGSVRKLHEDDMEAIYRAAL